MMWNEWFQLKDMELQKEFGVYVKWAKCAMGAGAAGGSCTSVKFAKFDQWKIHVADVENCEYWISTEVRPKTVRSSPNPSARFVGC
jgi:hypothetical protein